MRPYRSLRRQITNPEDAKGTQVAWDQSYGPQSKLHSNNGLHHFNAGEYVYRVDGRVGRVLSRTALTATVRWNDSKKQEVIDQFDERYISCPRP